MWIWIAPPPPAPDGGPSLRTLAPAHVDRRRRGRWLPGLKKQSAASRCVTDRSHPTHPVQSISSSLLPLSLFFPLQPPHPQNTKLLRSLLFIAFIPHTPKFLPQHTHTHTAHSTPHTSVTSHGLPATACGDGRPEEVRPRARPAPPRPPLDSSHPPTPGVQERDRERSAEMDPAMAAPTPLLYYLVLCALPHAVFAVPAAEPQRLQQQQEQQQRQRQRRGLERREHATVIIPLRTTVATTYTTIYYSTTVTRPASVRATTTVWVTRTATRSAGARASAPARPPTITNTMTITVTAERTTVARLRGRQFDSLWTPDAVTATRTFDDGKWTPDSTGTFDDGKWTPDTTGTFDDGRWTPDSTGTFDDGRWTPSALVSVVTDDGASLTPGTSGVLESTNVETGSAVPAQSSNARPFEAEHGAVTVTDTNVETVWDSTWRDVTRTATVTSGTVTSGYTTTTRFTTITESGTIDPFHGSASQDVWTHVTWARVTVTVQPAPPATPQLDDPSRTNRGAIAGGIVGVVVLAALIVGICVLMRRRSSKKERERRRNEKIQSAMGGGGALGGYTIVSGGSRSPAPQRPEAESLMGNGPPGVGVGEEHYSRPPATTSNNYGLLSPSPPLDSSNLPPVPRNWRSPTPPPLPVPATPTVIPPSSTASVRTSDSPTTTLAGGHLSPRPVTAATGNHHHHRHHRHYRSGSLAENIMPPPLPPMSERSSSGGSTTLHGSVSEHSLISPPSTAGNGAAPPPPPPPPPPAPRPPRSRELTVTRKSVPQTEESLHLLHSHQQGAGPSGGGGGGRDDDGHGGQYYW